MSIPDKQVREKAPGTQSEQPSESSKLTKKIRRAEESVKDYQFFFLRLVILLVVVWLLFFVFVGVTHMPSADMYPRIDPGDFVLFYRLDKDVKAQDIIVFEKAADSGEKAQRFVCRIVAAPGDTVEVSAEKGLCVNGNALIENNIFYPTDAYENRTEYPITLGSGEYFVMADRRNGGMDSRYFGTVKAEEIKGVVITVLRRNNL